MNISNLDIIKSKGTVRVEAEMHWEDVDKAPFRIFVQTQEEYEEFIWPDPNAFLIGSILPIWYSGESRIKIEGHLCPVLASKLSAVYMLLNTWYPDDFNFKPPILEPTEGFKVYKPFGEGAVSLLSCGIDSLAILRSNHQFFQPDHPEAIRATLSVAHRRTLAEDANELLAHANGRWPATTAVSQNLGCIPIPVSTNLWWLNPDNLFFSFKSHGAQLTACTAFFSKGFRKGYIGSSFDGAYMHKFWGSHPLLDNNFTSGHFQIEHTGIELTRMDKTRLVSNWKAGLNNIRVCQNDNTGSRNCGTCEKCIRTMTMLEALGKLRFSSAFPENDISPERVYYLQEYDMLFDPEQVYLYRLAIPLLEKRGRTDLVEALENIFANFFGKRASVL